SRLATNELDQPAIDNSRQLIAWRAQYSSNGHGKPSVQHEFLVEDNIMNQVTTFDVKRRTALRLNQPRSLAIPRGGYRPTLAVATAAFVLVGVLLLNTAPRPGREPLNSGALLVRAPLTTTPQPGGTDDIEGRIHQKLQTIQSTVPQWVQHG